MSDYEMRSEGVIVEPAYLKNKFNKTNLYFHLTEYGMMYVAWQFWYKTNEELAEQLSKLEDPYDMLVHLSEEHKQMFIELIERALTSK